MSKWALIIDTGDGLDVVVFGSQRESDAWEAAHPEVTDCVTGGIRVITQRSALAATAHLRD